MDPTAAMINITVATQGITGAIAVDKRSANVAIGTFQSPVNLIGTIKNKIPKIDGTKNKNHVESECFFIISPPRVQLHVYEYLYMITNFNSFVNRNK